MPPLSALPEARDPMNAAAPLLVVDGLRKHFPAARGGVVKAIEDVSFTVPRRKIVGLVGECRLGQDHLPAAACCG